MKGFVSFLQPKGKKNVGNFNIVLMGKKLDLIYHYYF